MYMLANTEVTPTMMKSSLQLRRSPSILEEHSCLSNQIPYGKSRCSHSPKVLALGIALQNPKKWHHDICHRCRRKIGILARQKKLWHKRNANRQWRKIWSMVLALLKHNATLEPRAKNSIHRLPMDLYVACIIWLTFRWQCIWFWVQHVKDKLFSFDSLWSSDM